MGSCCWQLRSVTLTAAFSVVVSNKTPPREPTSCLCDSSVNKTLKHYGSMFSSESLVDRIAELEFLVHGGTSAVKVSTRACNLLLIVCRLFASLVNCSS